MKYVKNKEKKMKQSSDYYKKNRDIVIQKNRVYRESNIETINERRKKMYICPCNPNKELLYDHKSRHNQTLKHIKFLATVQETKE